MTMPMITLTTGRVMTLMTWGVAAPAIHLVEVRWCPYRFLSTD
jgi:hypothetical protein